MADSISNAEDIIDSRDIEERIDELEAERGDLESEVENAQEALDDAEADCTHASHGDGDTTGELAANRDNARKQLDVAKGVLIAFDESEDGDELKALKAFRDELEPYCEDWRHGATVIRDSYFTEYAEQLADDIGAINKENRWPLCHIDWEAAAESLKQDYTSGEFDGVTYWAR